MKIKDFLAVLVLLCGASAAGAMNTTTLAPLDQQRLLEDDAEVDGPVPLRVSIGYAVAVSPKTSELLVEKEGHVWRHAFEVPGATELSLAFGDFELPAGAELYVYDEDKYYVRGPYTAADIREHRELWTPVVPGERAIVELILPQAVDQEAAKGRTAAKAVKVPGLRVMQVNAGYRDLFGLKGEPNLTRQLACNIDVVCPQADPWRDELRAVARYTINIGGSGFLCTGQLVMDQPGTLTPYFMTAHHCGPSAATDQTMVFYWNFESPTCGQLGGGSLNQAQGGAIYRAGRQNVDSSLVELEEMPNEDFQVYYAGWDASGSTPSGGSVGIHHPGGDEKSISINTGPAGSISVCIAGTSQLSGFWLVNWEDGTTEPGSSGSALWRTSNKKVIGTLSGGSSACIGPNPNGQTDCYGKTWAAWTGGANDTQRLKPWLDPNDTGQLVVDGMDPTAGECGDSALNLGEACDDGNTANGDGCSSSCQVESGWDCELPVNQRGIADGSFEGGTPNGKWTEFSTNFGSPICTTGSCSFGAPSAGIWFGYFGREADGEVGSLEQHIVIPDDATTLTFKHIAFSCDNPDDFLRATIDGVEVIRINGDDPLCGGFTYLPRTGDITAFADNGAHLLRIESEVSGANGDETRFLIDEISIDGDTSGPGAAGSCTELPEVCLAEDFESGLANWTTFRTGAVNLNWGTTNDGVCNSNPQTPDGNFTGGSGAAACVDSDAAGPGQADSYLCGPAIDLTTAVAPAMSFLHNYQIDGPPGADDSFSLLIGTQAPSAGTIGSYDLVFEELLDTGAAFSTPGFEANLDLSAYGGQQVYACFQYRADFDWYAQIDDYRVTAQQCIGELMDADGDGVSDAADLCPNTPPGEAVNADGCSDSQLDDDNDGVSNAADLCPNTPPGEPVDADGCSDAQLDDDNDGVSNAVDLCPGTPPGEAVDADGCSDSQLDDDNDGVSNAADLCPNTPPGEPVDADGCSDAQLDDDNDGVSNAVDLCPGTPPGEVVDADGCSDSQLDDDNDGVSNAVDLCPNTPPGEPVDADGCSDAQLDDDNDGVSNAVDLCPGTPPGEVVDADGCSDSQLDDDNDGVSNAVDLCPGTPPGEPVDADGCSDSQLDDDNDGVSNAVDLCPNTPPGEPVDADGCSDAQLDDDNDGVSNAVDLCPGTPPGEPVDADGCSDSQLDDDNDGVSNAVDLCPNTPPGEPVDADGCSDAQLDDDNDGVSNAVDLCPGTPPGEVVDADGCSDSQLDDDNDGVSNAVDLCPGTPPGEPVDADGCSDSQLDTDGDGVFDLSDNCTLVQNNDQRDTDGDNIGNACDADMDNNCLVNFPDSLVYRANFFMPGDLDTDNNGDGATNFVDLAVLNSQFFGAPGPSGLPNACN